MNSLVKNGFTLLEILIAVAIIGLLLAIAVPSYSQLRKNVMLKNYTEDIVNTLRLAQNKSITSQDGKPWGVHFETNPVNSYTLYRDDGSGYSGATSKTVYQLNGGVKIISSTFDVLFNHLTGTTILQHDIVIGFTGGSQKTVRGEVNGKISIL